MPLHCRCDAVLDSCTHSPNVWVVITRCSQTWRTRTGRRGGSHVKSYILGARWWLNAIFFCRSLCSARVCCTVLVLTPRRLLYLRTRVCSPFTLTTTVLICPTKSYWSSRSSKTSPLNRDGSPANVGPLLAQGATLVPDVRVVTFSPTK